MTQVDFDSARLKAYLKAEFGYNASLALERIGGGQSNPTYCLDYGEQHLVLRKKPFGPILRGAHAIEREFRVMKALFRTEVPVPEPVLYCEDSAVLGTPFYLMQRLEGRVFHDTSLPGLLPTERRAIYLSMAQTLAGLHAVRPNDVELSDFGRPGNYFQRQIERWSRQWHESPTENIPDLDRLLEWLIQHMPADDGQVSIAHGDFRLGNLLFHPSEPRILGVLDWELSTLGHPLADLGFSAMLWHTTPDEYGGILGLDVAGLGLPQEAEFIRHYHAHALPTGSLLPFHIAFSLFRFAVIFVGIADRARQGNASGQNAHDIAPLAARFARRGLEVAGL